jgi:predicted transcriptional regulator
MKTATLSIRLDDDLDALLGKATRETGRSRSTVAREALRRQLRITQFETIRRRMMPFAEARGFLTDEDVFAHVS